MGDEQFFNSWCKQFVKWTSNLKVKYNLVGQKSILFLDGHSSRNDFDTVNYLKENDVHVITIPSHTSHVTQPIDVLICSPFKAYLKKNKSKYLKMKI